MQLALVTAVLCVAQFVSGQGPRVNTTLGVVEGQLIYVNTSDKYVVSFHGIPYAKPPIGDLRFEKPQPADPYTEVFVANRLGNACVQAEVGLLWATHPGFNRYSEDCLNLDVYTPENMNPETLYAVMVFFHGGAFQSGSSIQYPGHFYAVRDTILVAVNYRLNIFGFMSTNDSVAPGNYGLYDQRLALQWVRDNIARFGGDSGRVTIFGQSAGAASSGLHMVSPGSQGLFHAVIEESGSDVIFWSINWPNSQHWTFTEKVAFEVGCPTSPTSDMVSCLKTIDEWVLYNATTKLECTPGYFCLGFSPVVDGPDGFLPDIPLRLRNKGEFAKVPLITGYLSEDGALYVVAYVPEVMSGVVTRDDFNYYVEDRLLGMFLPAYPQQTQDDLNAVMNWYYSPWPFINNSDSNIYALNKMMTDGGFGYASELQARYQSMYADTYMYLFGYRSNNSYSGIYEPIAWMGCFHSCELPYVFDWSLLYLNEEVRRDSKIFIDLVPWNEMDVDYANFVTDMWTNFAKFSNPTPEPIITPLGGEPVTWEKYSLPEGKFNIFEMNATVIRTIPEFRQQEDAFFRRYIPYVIDMEFLPPVAADQKDLPPPIKESGVPPKYSPKYHFYALQDAVVDIMLKEFDQREIDTKDFSSEY